MLVLLGPALAVSDPKLRHRALLFGRTNYDYIQFQPDDMSPFTSSFTLCSWIKKLHSASSPIVFQYLPGQIIIGDHGNWNYVNQFLAVPDKFPEANEWFHHCLSWTAGGAHRVYLNGVEVGNKTASSRDLKLGGSICLGNRASAIKHSNYIFGGELYKLDIYSEQLTSSQISEIADSGMCSEVEEKYETRRLKWEEILTKERQGNVTEFVPEECTMSDINYVKNKLTQTEAELTLTKKRLQNTKSRLNSFDSALQQVSKGLITTMSELTEIRTQLNETQAELEEKETRLHETETELKAKESRLQESENECNRTKDKLQEVSILLNGTLSELTQTRTQLNETRTVLKEKKTRLRKTKAKLKKKDEKLQESKNEAQEKENKLQETETECNRTKGELQEVSITLNGTLSELTEIRIQLNETQTELEEKKARLQESMTEQRAKENRLKESETECMQVLSQQRHDGVRVFDLTAECASSIINELETRLKKAENDLKQTKKTLRNTNKKLER